MANGKRLTEMNNSTQDRVIVTESDVNGPYAQIVTAGRHILSADEAESVGGHDPGPSVLWDTAFWKRSTVSRNLIRTSSIWCDFRA
jgi:hypothetical protein